MPVISASLSMVSDCCAQPNAAMAPLAAAWFEALL